MAAGFRFANKVVACRDAFKFCIHHLAWDLHVRG
jgi:hypothetical protein